MLNIFSNKEEKFVYDRNVGLSTEEFMLLFNDIEREEVKIFSRDIKDINNYR